MLGRKQCLFKTGVNCFDENDIQTLKKKHNLDNGFLREIGLEHLEMIILCQNCLRLIKKRMHPSNNEQMLYINVV